ncbi:LytTR family DNA-binding domain-containing protein [Enterococcus sp. LJL120]
MEPMVDILDVYSELQVSILSPVLDTSCVQLIQYVKAYCATQEQNFYVFTDIHRDLYKINQNDIEYVDVRGKLVTLFTERKEYVVAERFYKVLDGLDSEIFFQPGKSYAVNLKKVLSLQHHFTGQTLALLKSGKTVPISRRLLTDLKTKLLQSEGK